jgi:hypothetical protein
LSERAAAQKASNPILRMLDFEASPRSLPQSPKIFLEQACWRIIAKARAERNQPNKMIQVKDKVGRN